MPTPLAGCVACCSCRSAAVSPHQHCPAQRQSNKGKRKFLWICISETSEGPSALPLAPRATCVALALQTGTMGKREQRENPVWQIKRQMKRKQRHWWNRKYVRDRVRRMCALNPALAFFLHLRPLRLVSSLCTASAHSHYPRSSPHITTSTRKGMATI